MNGLDSPKRIAIATGVVLLLALLVLALLPGKLPTRQGLARSESAWELPVAMTVDADAALSVINQRRLFGQSNTAGQPADGPSADDKGLTPPNWRIAGVYGEGAHRALLVLTDGRFEAQQLRVGDVLPGGAKIIGIASDRVSLLLHGQRVSLSTYPQ